MKKIIFALMGIFIAANAFGATIQVSAVAPAAGKMEAGTAVTITGTDFTDPATVTFSSAGSTVVGTSTVTVNSLHITTVAPAAAVGAYGVIVSGAPNTLGSLAAAYTVTKPTPASILPATGKMSGGDTVTLAGTYFCTGSTVTINAVACTSVTKIDDQHVSVVTPAGTAGAKNVIMTYGGQSTTLAGAYTYSACTYTSIAPTDGPLNGGTPVTIVGAYFNAGSTVNIAGVLCTSVVITDNLITCVTPAAAAGAQNLVITSLASTTTAAGAFTYHAPTITSSNPMTGGCCGGTSVKIVGTYLCSAGATVGFGTDNVTTYTVNSAGTTLTVTSPAKVSGAVYDVTVGYGASTATESNGWTVPATTITSVSPLSGIMGGGTVVKVAGTNFCSDCTVAFGSTAATAVSVNTAGTTITCTSPFHASGAVNVVVTQHGDTITDSNAFTYVKCTITSITPSTGKLAGGDAVAIVGTWFSSGSTVTIGGVCTGVATPTANLITATTAIMTAGAHNVVITFGNETTTMSSGFFGQKCTITSCTPGTGSPLGGDRIVLAGTYFCAGSTVKINAVDTTTTVDGTATSVSATTAAYAPGVYDVTVAYGASRSTLSSGFTYKKANVISVTPGIGTAAGGTAVTIYGADFCTGATATIAGSSLMAQTQSGSNLIYGTTQATASGLYDVVVSYSNYAPSTLSNGFQFTLGTLQLDPDQRTPVHYVKVLNGVTSTTISPSVFVGNYKAISFIVQCTGHSSGNGVFTVQASPDGKNFFSYPKLIGTAGLSTPATSVTLSTNTTNVMALSPEDGVSWVQVTCTVTTDGAYSCWIMAK
jgi:hypothetical protein